MTNETLTGLFTRFKRMNFMHVFTFQSIAVVLKLVPDSSPELSHVACSFQLSDCILVRLTIYCCAKMMSFLWSSGRYILLFTCWTSRVGNCHRRKKTFKK